METFARSSSSTAFDLCLGGDSLFYDQTLEGKGKAEIHVTEIHRLVPEAKHSISTLDKAKQHPELIADREIHLGLLTNV
ncbi:hypothetical protein SARC_03126 [Sphaeroforma arctica JP610]|uniref:Uncharacterized protein n=1 Tax=Sphaeroforma arctica JP610 TaxID=667725 RepID=A0A0L0G6M3_9EUKA|nr:hypothetical protein SARC_03126 [Sphaeroforma arctica JP610]KNC84665.1 hypothetical protein SARC_03126 [Sphaeroforma arctica JP610]|eukprot:XP_014158567.1 hypothetical protein SARC_03126 [Sphaeroforma arctica JP610]